MFKSASVAVIALVALSQSAYANATSCAVKITGSVESSEEFKVLGKGLVKLGYTLDQTDKQYTLEVSSMGTERSSSGAKTKEYSMARVQLRIVSKEGAIVSLVRAKTKAGSFGSTTIAEALDEAVKKVTHCEAID